MKNKNTEAPVPHSLWKWIAMVKGSDGDSGSRVYFSSSDGGGGGGGE